MRNLLPAGRAATAGLMVLLSPATLVAVRTPVAASSGGRTSATGDNVVLLWDEATLQGIRDTRLPPTVTARALAVVHASIYEAWGGLPVKWLGDGVMFFFKRPGTAVPSALEMVHQAPAAGLPPATSASMPGRSWSRTATTSAARSTSPPGSQARRRRSGPGHR